jgi:DNA repair protein RecO (recombination protein O)
MKLVRVRGIVIRHYPFRESSDVIVFYSRSLGKVKFLARGRRRPSSQLGAPLELFTLSEVVMYIKEGRDLQTVKEAKLIASLPELTKDYIRYIYASAVCEFVDRTLAESDGSRALFDLTWSGIELMAGDPEENLPVLFDSYLLKALSILGHRPTLRSCVTCRSRTGLTHFSPERGGVVCSSCASADPTARPLDGGTLEVLKALIERPFPRVRRMRYGDGRLRGLILEFARIHTGVNDLLGRFESAISGVP